MPPLIPGAAKNAVHIQPVVQVHRKRSHTNPCLNPSRAKRLRQELLRLRQWEQETQQKKIGLLEGQADSLDPSFDVSPPQPPCGFPLGVTIQVGDSWDSTNPGVHDQPCAAIPVSAKERMVDPVRVAPGTPTRPNPTNLRCKSLLQHPVQKGRDAACHRVSSSFLASTGAPSGTLTGLSPLASKITLASGRRGTSQGSWSDQSFDLMVSGASDPLGDLAPAVCSDTASVQQCVIDGCGSGEEEVDVVEVDEVAGLSCQAEEWVSGGEENLPREETSQGGTQGEPSSPLDAAQGEDFEDAETDIAMEEPAGNKVQGVAAEANCSLGKRGRMTLPPVPPNFLGMQTPQRQRITQFFLQAGEILGLGLRSVYWASVMLDCFWVESKRQGRGFLGVVSTPGRDLRDAALQCLLHVFLGATRPESLSRAVKVFCGRLQSGCVNCPVVASMLPVREACMMQGMLLLNSFFPAAALRGCSSTSPCVYRELLEAWGVCSKKQHMLAFILHLRAAGYSGIPPHILDAACCLHSSDLRGDGEKDVGVSAGHLHEHIEALQRFLFQEDDVLHTGIQHVERIVHDDLIHAEPEKPRPEESLQISV